MRIDVNWLIMGMLAGVFSCGNGKHSKTDEDLGSSPEKVPATEEAPAAEELPVTERTDTVYEQCEAYRLKLLNSGQLSQQDYEMAKANGYAPTKRSEDWPYFDFWPCEDFFK